jgi:hypothetical protein
VKLCKGLIMAHSKDDPASIQQPFRPCDCIYLTQSHIVEILMSPFFRQEIDL